MRKLIDRTMGLADTAGLFFANLAAVILLGLVALTCVDVVGRYLFSRPVTGATELVRICMAGIIFFSFPLMFLRNDHIIVDLFAIFRRGWVGWVTALAVLAVTIVVAVVLADRITGYAVRAWEDGDTAEYIGIPRWPIVGFITISVYGAAVAAGLRALSFLAHPGAVPEDTPGEDRL